MTPSLRARALAIGSFVVVVAIVAGIGAHQLTQGGARAPAPPASPATIIFRLLNERRARAHLPPLTRDLVLASWARIHNADMLREDYFAHDAPQGQTFSERLAYLHRREVGEVIAWGTGSFGTPAGIVSLWMASKEHRRIILTRALRRVGVSILGGRFQGQTAARVATADFST